jgi:hypothetical protein
MTYANPGNQFFSLVDMDNTASLVYVNAGNAFVMGAGSAITGNRSTGSSYDSAARVSGVGARFTMSGDDAFIGYNQRTVGYGGAVSVMASGAFTMSGVNAEISGNYATGGWGGGGVYMCETTYGVHGEPKSQFIMSGANAKISGNYSTGEGGGVYVIAHSEFTMSGANAKISGNYATGEGGGVFVNSVSEFTMSGANAEISGNITASVNGGGGVRMVTEVKFTMSGENAAISGNTATNGYGGGVSMYHADPQFIMSGANAVISGNTAALNGGGVYMEDTGLFTMEGENAVISGNTANRSNGGGGGVNIYNAAHFIMSGANAAISGNIATNNGGGVRVRDAEFTMSGANAVISGNSAGYDGGGVLCNNGNVTMEAGEISGNTAHYVGQPYLHQFAYTGGGTQKWPAGTRASVTGTSGVGNDYNVLHSVDTAMGGPWYGNQLVGTVIKVWNAGDGGSSPGEGGSPAPPSDALDLTSSIPAPVQAAEPVPAVANAAGGGVTASFWTADYTAVITWSKTGGLGPTYPGVFNYNTGKFYSVAVYTATVVLTARQGYSFAGVAENTVTYSNYGHTDPADETIGWIRNAAGSASTLTVIIVFPKTEGSTVIIGAVGGVPLRGNAGQWVPSMVRQAHQPKGPGAMSNGGGAGRLLSLGASVAERARKARHVEASKHRPFDPSAALRAGFAQGPKGPTGAAAGC